VRCTSVAGEFRMAQRLHVASLSPDERVRLALSLGTQSLELLRSEGRLSVDEARRLRERRLQSRRRPSACLEALLR
jgi:hypothetical protein